MPRTWVGELQMYYELHGDGEPLVLIHGLGSSSRDWEMQVPYFAERFQVLCVDLRGHGQTDKPRGPYTIEIFARDVARLMDKLGFGPAHIIGISMGGSTAFHLALDHPHLVRTLTVANMGPEILVDGAAAWQKYLSRYLIARLLGPKKMGAMLAPRLFPYPHQEHLRQKLITRWGENDSTAYLTAMLALKNWSVKDRLSTIRQPTLIITGDSDYTPIAVKQDSVDRIPDAELVVIDDARHALPAERPDQFNDAVGAFLEKNRSVL